MSILPASAWAKRAHVVKGGDTLWGLARDYECNVESLKELNQIKGSHIVVGQRLKVPSSASGGKPATRIRTKSKIHTKARQVEREPTPDEPLIEASEASVLEVTAQDLSVQDLESIEEANSEITSMSGVAQSALMFATIDSARLDPLPQELPFFEMEEETHEEAVQEETTQQKTTQEKTTEPYFVGQSVGRTNRGRLVRATRFRRMPGAHIRRPHRSFGTYYAVEGVRAAVKAVKEKFPRVHRLAIGDFSQRSGGKITMHASHRSGRDVDLGFYFKKKPEHYPRDFVVATPKEIHFGATWNLLKSLVDSASSPTGVEKIFLGYRTQRILYRIAKRRGVSQSELERIFQFPAGRSAPTGIVRHEPKHDDHFHIRFKCPPGDIGCL